MTEENLKVDTQGYDLKGLFGGRPSLDEVTIDGATVEARRGGACRL